MKRVTTILGGFVAILAVAGVLGVSGLSTTVSAADDNSNKESKAQTSKSDKKTTAVKDRTYTASPGDSYTAMVRKAVQTYGINSKVNLGNARIVYIETMMTQAAGNPYLWAGQSVTIKGSDIKAWADKSSKLSDADIAAWETYVPYIDFDTKSVGKGE